MKKHPYISIVLLWVIMSPLLAQEGGDDVFSFIAAADMRFYATEKYQTPQHFLGALEAIKKVGAGSLMISSGDIDPPEDVRAVIDDVLGEEYPWYPCMGNHELESNEYIENNAILGSMTSGECVYCSWLISYISC